MSTTPSTKAPIQEIAVFSTLKQAITRRFNELIDSTSQGNQLFIAAVSKDVLWDTYLNAFPEGTNPVYKTRREYDCSTCRHFIKNLGGLVSVSPNGSVQTLWSGLSRTLPYPFNVVVAKQARLLSTAAIDRPFLTTEMQYGVDKNYAHPDGGALQTWEHFFAKVPSTFVRTSAQIGPEFSERRASHDVLLRALKEIDLETVDAVLDLIRQGSLYRGEEKLHDLVAFRGVKAAFDELVGEAAAQIYELEVSPEVLVHLAELQDRFAWVRSTTLPGSVSRIRNTSLGTLLVDLAEGTDLDAAVGKYEAIMAPTNYKRPTALVTPKMTAAAREEVARLGLTSALERRYAVLEDVSVTNVLFADRSARGVLKHPKGSAEDAFAALAETACGALSPRAFDKVETVSVAKFLSDVLPHATSLEVLFESKHAGNLVSLIAPQHQDESTARLFKWPNPFSWSYAGEVADAVKERVKAAGGNVTGDLCCRLAWDYSDDLDFYMEEPGDAPGSRNSAKPQIYYSGYRRSLSPNGGMLDLDANGCDGVRTDPAENIFYADRKTMRSGVYRLWVNNYARRSSGTGFTAQVEFDGQVHEFHYPKALRTGEDVAVATITYDAKTREFTIQPAFPSTTQSKDLWGLKTQAWARVNVVTLSPNWWDMAGHEDADTDEEIAAEEAIPDTQGARSSFYGGNRHTFFMLDGCANPGEARGFYNEFLRQDLTKHRKVMELVGSKLRVEQAERQLSGLGFSSTKRDVLTLRVTGSATTRVLRVQF